MDEGKAGYNFAFYMILFITIFTGGYYAYGKIKDKFFPQSTVSDYVKKKWRYWDDRRSQVHKYIWCTYKCFYVFHPAWRAQIPCVALRSRTLSEVFMTLCFLIMLIFIGETILIYMLRIHIESSDLFRLNCLLNRY